MDLAMVAGNGPEGRGSIEYSESVRNLKTSALMRLALRTGAILSGATYMELASLSRFAELMGDAYQLSDDLIDLAEDDELFAGEQKPLAVADGSTAAKVVLGNTIEEAKRVLIENFDSSGARSVLVQLTDYLAERKG